jgi:ferredoxin
VTRAPAGGGVSLRIDATACQGIGMCAFVAPTLIGVDDWGYPVLAPGPLVAAEVRRALTAVAACPRRALFLAERR